MHKAASLAPDRVQEALAEFRRLNSREARAAFADYWIGVWAQDFEYAWPMLYELLSIVKEDKLYADPKRVGPGAPGDASAHGQASSYKDFAAYFEDRVKRPWQQWAELEATYQYASHYAKDLLNQIFGKACDAMQRAKQLLKARDNGVVINEGRGPRTEEERSIDDIIINRPTGLGTSADYLTLRIARERPDVLQRMAAGEVRSVRAAALEARIPNVHRSVSVRLDSAESAARTLRKHMPPGILSELIELLTKED